MKIAHTKTSETQLARLGSSAIRGAVDLPVGRFKFSHRPPPGSQERR